MITIIMKIDDTGMSEKRYCWFKDGFLHRDFDQPAVWFKTDPFRSFFKDKRCYRVIESDGTVCQTEEELERFWDLDAASFEACYE